MPLMHVGCPTSHVRRASVKVAAAAAAAAAPVPTEVEVSEVAKQNLKRAAESCRHYGWVSFWCQLTLTVVSSTILLFSVAFTSQNGPEVSLYLTTFGVIMGFLSTFWAYGYTRLAKRLKEYIKAPLAQGVRKIKRSDVLGTLERGVLINIVGISAVLVGLSANVGTLVAKTLTNATANPFLASGQGAWSPVLALDIFNVQAATNAVLSHFVSLVVSLWLLRVIGKSKTA